MVEGWIVGLIGIGMYLNFILIMILFRFYDPLFQYSKYSSKLYVTLITEREILFFGSNVLCFPGKIEVLFAIQDVFYLDNQFSVLNTSV